MSEEIEIDYLRTWIGKQDRVSDTISAELLKRFRATLSGYSELSLQIPLGIHWCLAQTAVAQNELGVDGHPAKGGFLPPVPLPRRMWASSQLRFHKPLSSGVPVEKVSTIADVALKQSASSGPLVFVHVDHEYVQSGETLVQERQSIVYRQSSVFKQPEVAVPKYSACSLNIFPNTTLLFRYSAVTFNGHRIHYDSRYTTTEEGYPGLVVHGPLIATLLMNLAQANRPNSSMTEFTFRAVAPAFVDQALQLAINDEDVRYLEARNHEGALVMSAQAKFGINDES
ncbi:MAG: 3-methylfumaryl-CoA hydratase [Halioglobus sp.]